MKNPKDDSLISSDLNEANEDDVDLAVDHATEAYRHGPWKTFPGKQRGACLYKLADLIEQHSEEIAYFESIASGRPIAMTSADIPMVVDVFRCKIWSCQILSFSFTLT